MAKCTEPKDDRIKREPSLYINDAMDYLGYSKDSISLRRYVVSQMKTHGDNINMKIFSLLNTRAESIITGSKAEGVAKTIESDIDVLMVLRNFLCLDDAHRHNIENDKIVVKTHMTDSPPGYTRLIPLNGNDGRVVESSLLDVTTVYDLRQGVVYISSLTTGAFYEANLRNIEYMYDGMHYEVKERCGPSSPLSFRYNLGGYLGLFTSQLSMSDSDIVTALPYFSATFLKSWSERSRMYGWPSRDVIKNVSKMEGYVVPVGPKYCEEQNLEWRISYTTAENILVTSLNAVQLKVYVLMKMMFKQIIKNDCDFISSFMIKTVVFWVCERTHIRVFTPENLLNLLCQVISFLLQCLNANFLPNYIIPKSNLLHGKGSAHERMKLRRILWSLLNNGGLDVLRLEKLSVVTNVILKNPRLGKEYGEWRDQLENVVQCVMLLQISKATSDNVLQQSFIYECLYDTCNDPRYLRLSFSLLELLNVKIADFVSDPVSAGQNIKKVVDWHLS